MVFQTLMGRKPMFHLIRKYSNRKLYDIATRSFIKQEDLLMLVIGGEEVRIEDNDTHIDITSLELQKAFARFPELQRLYVSQKTQEKSPTSSPLSTETGLDIPLSHLDENYVPAEIRLLYKSLEYLLAALRILATEPVYNAALHADLVENFLAIEKRLRKLKKKHKLL
ncbi:MAG: polyhydroxyalkanoate synthesis regulator DNA-binding domain-containing protein [Brevinematales bacterium]|nr:polyhydroxyalkanoate synthesis regulator DNA-binding domain-containing protein [Brevinematales bacterium]